jgi:PhzF family phenazine biosynthesis protein
MKKLNYKKIDAFTSNNSLGNPAACLYLGKEKLLPEEMLNIAFQHKGFVSEVVFCTEIVDGSYKLTYYSSECEVDFCGHGTIACMHSLIKNDPKLLALDKIIIDTTKKGKLTIYNKIKDNNCVYITAPAPQNIGTNLSKSIIAKNLGINEDEISNAYPIDLINAGLSTLIVPLNNFNTEISVFPKIEIIKKFCESNSIDIILIYSMAVQNKDNFAHTRVFAPKFGYLEDPATGSGNSAFGNYLLKNKLWQGNDISLEQGGNDRIFNKIMLSTDNGKVLFGGTATEKIVGNYYL